MRPSCLHGAIARAATMRGFEGDAYGKLRHEAHSSEDYDVARDQNDGLGAADPMPRDDMLGGRELGDEQADNADDPKIVDYPEHSEDITEQIEEGRVARGFTFPVRAPWRSTSNR